MSKRLQEIEKYFRIGNRPIPEEHFEYLLDRVRKLEGVLQWYAEGYQPGEFSIVDKNRQFISDLSAFGIKAKQALEGDGDAS